MKAWALYNINKQRVYIGSLLTGVYEPVVSITPGEIETVYRRTLTDQHYMFKILEIDTDTGEYRVLDPA